MLNKSDFVINSWRRLGKERVDCCDCVALDHPAHDWQRCESRRRVCLCRTVNCRPLLRFNATAMHDMAEVISRGLVAELHS